MILDDNLEFADATSVGTPNNTTVAVGNDIDLGFARDIGGGVPLYLVVQVTTAITSGGSATVRFKLASDAAAPAQVDGTQTEHITTDTVPVATLVAGYQVVIPIPAGGTPAYERFLSFQIEEDAGQALTAGNVNAFLTHDARTYTGYADAIN